jgi:hypothetical protein
MKWVKRIAKWGGIALLVLVLSLAVYVGGVAYAFSASVDEVYAIELPDVERSSDPAVIARGEHLAHSLAACALSDCHGEDLGGGRFQDLGPLGTMVAPNITAGGLGAEYSDAELARVIMHGVKRDGRTLRWMPAHETAWFPESDVVALVSWVRSKPAVDRPSRTLEVGLLGQFLDRHDLVPIVIARRIDHSARPDVPEPAPTAEYGAFIGEMCRGCHGQHLSGGPIPGAPPDMPIPPNLTVHDSGLASWSYEDFTENMRERRGKDGHELAAMMPTEAITNMNDTERRALWEYLRSVPPRPFGER